MAKRKVRKSENQKFDFKRDYRKNKELYWIIGTMAGLLILFFIFSYIFQSIGKFEYEGIAFTKEKFGEIPVFHHYYLFKNTEGEIVKYNLYLRIDPRTNNVPIEPGIEFPVGKFAYISINSTGLSECEYASAGVASVASFLANNDIKVKGAIPDKEEAEEKNIEYATCGFPEQRTVVLIQSGEKTEVTKQGEMCHVISINNCEVLEATEKFIVQALKEARQRAEDANAK